MQLTPKTLENRAALRTAIAVLIAVLIAFSLHFDKPYWSGMTVVILANVYTGSVIDKAILRIVGTLIGAFFGYIVAGLVANSLLLYLLANFLLISFAVYYYNFSPHGYAYLLGALAAIFVISQLAFTPSQAFYVAIWRSLEIGLGVLVSAAAALFIFPNNIQDNLAKDVNLMFDQMISLLERLSKVVLTGGSDFQTIAADNAELRKKIKTSTDMIGYMRRELGIKRERIDQFRVLHDQFFSLTRTITYFISSYDLQKNAERDFTRLNKPVMDIFTAAIEDLRILKKEFFGKGKVQENLKMENLFASLHQEITSHISEVEEETISIETIKRYLDMMPLLRQTNNVISNLGNVLIHHQVLVNPETRLITSQQQLRTDSDIIISSIKTGLAGVLALAFWLLTNWPNGLTGIVSSLVISMRRNLFTMSDIAIHRLLGCIIGSSIALLPLGFFSMDLYDFILIVFCSIWAFSYFSFKFVPYSYIGLQASVVTVIFMAQEGGPPIELEPALERLAGVVIGIVASFLVGNVIWRTDYFSILTRHLHKLYCFLIYNLTQLLQAEPKKARVYDLTGLFWLCRGLLEAFPENHFKGKKLQRLAQAKNRFEQMILIQATLSHIYDGIDRTKAHETAANYDFNLKALENALAAFYNSDVQEKSNQIKQQLDEILAKVDLSAYYAKSPSHELNNCIAYVSALNQLKLSRIDNY